jgi:TetR/AcrR family transcriptional repressor of mexJK operon
MSDKNFPGNGPGRPKDLAKREAILEAAKCLFLRHGYDGCSMDAIASHAGVSKLTVYSHFNDKETLFAAAVKAKCEEQLPDLLFEPTEEAPIKALLVKIGLGFNRLINSAESVGLHRTMIALATSNPRLSKLFYEAGPKQLIEDMARLLIKLDRAGKLRILDPHSAAEHFFCLLKGGHHFRHLIGCAEMQSEDDEQAHVRDVVEVFLRAFSA